MGRGLLDVPCTCPQKSYLSDLCSPLYIQDVFTSVSVDNLSFTGNVILILEGHQQLDCVAPLEMDLDSHFVANTFKAIGESFCIGDNHVDVLVLLLLLCE